MEKPKLDYVSQETATKAREVINIPEGAIFRPRSGFRYSLDCYDPEGRYLGWVKAEDAGYESAKDWRLR
jgi:hypothetical protein